MSTIISLLSASIILLHQFKEKNNPLKFKFYFKWEDAFKMLKAGFEDALLFYLFFTLFMSFYNWFLLKYFNVDALIIFTFSFDDAIFIDSRLRRFGTNDSTYNCYLQGGR